MRYESKEQAQQDHITRYRSDGIAKGKGERYSSDFHRVQWIVSNVPKKSVVLDVGCNGGTVGVKLLQTLNCYVRGIDIVEELVSKAVERGIFAKVGVAEELIFEDEQFDAVICAEVLEHLYDPMPAIKEAFRVLKTGGRYIVTVPHPNNPVMAGDKLGDYHQQNFTMEMLDTLFHCVFERGSVTFQEIPYIAEYLQANRLPEGMMGWLGIVAVKTAQLAGKVSDLAHNQGLAGFDSRSCNQLTKGV